MRPVGARAVPRHRLSFRGGLRVSRSARAAVGLEPHQPAAGADRRATGVAVRDPESNESERVLPATQSCALDGGPQAVRRLVHRAPQGAIADARQPAAGRNALVSNWSEATQAEPALRLELGGSAELPG